VFCFCLYKEKKNSAMKFFSISPHNFFHRAGMYSQLPMLVLKLPPPWYCAASFNALRAHSSQHSAMVRRDTGLSKRDSLLKCSHVLTAIWELQVFHAM